MNLRQFSVLFSRIALFVIYFWFGILKIIGQSPASPLVQALFTKTLAHVPLLSFPVFLVLFGLFEMLIGILFLIPGRESVVLWLFFLHMITTTMPLFLVAGLWTHRLVPTLEAQYIIKNLALIACALSIASIIPSKKERAQAEILETEETAIIIE